MERGFELHSTTRELVDRDREERQGSGDQSTTGSPEYSVLSINIIFSRAAQDGFGNDAELKIDGHLHPLGDLVSNRNDRISSDDKDNSKNRLHTVGSKNQLTPC